MGEEKYVRPFSWEFVCAAILALLNFSLDQADIHNMVVVWLSIIAIAGLCIHALWRMEWSAKVGYSSLKFISCCLLILLLCSAFGFYIWLHKRRESVKEAVQGTTHKPATLHDLWESDFPNTLRIGFVQRSAVLGNGTQVPFEGKQVIDADSAVKFVSIYVPSSPGAYEACAGLAAHIADVGGLNLFHFQEQGNGSESVDTKVYQFSGRVFIYHENFFTPEQEGDLHKIYTANHLVLESRGENYRQLILLQRIAEKNATKQQP